MALFRRGASSSDTNERSDAVQAEVVGTPAPSDAGLPPSRMRGTEPLYGYVVGLELLVVAILNIVITKGKGAPAHPQTGLQILAVAAPLVFVGLLQLRNRTIAGFSAIVAAFFVTLPKVPNSLSVAHVFALAIPLAYGLIITQRQRRAIGNTARRGGRASRASSKDVAQGGSARTTGSAEARTDRRRGRKKGQDAVPTGPRPNARYTPPKAKRGKATR